MTFKTIAAALTALAVSGAAEAADMGDTGTPIRLSLNNWTGQQLSTYIAGGMLEEAGYTVEYVEADQGAMYEQIASGDVHAMVEIWTTSNPADYFSVRDDGRVEELGDLGLDARNGVVFPPYVAQMCPGLPDWTALRNCAGIFSKDGKGKRGVYLAYPESWGSPGADRIRALDLTFDVVAAESEAAMIEAFQKAYKEKRPVISTFWAPHWAMSSYALQFVRLPKPEPACYTDPSWGPNPNATGDCDFYRGGVVKASWTGFKERWPAAYEILKNYELSIWDQQPLIGLVDVRGETVPGAARGWLAVNRAKWMPVVEEATGKGRS
ncbi:glycine/betaine ABC transporter substrate-binding protein [Leisingera sp. ANG-M1]|uniref:ABC transporter substrate-binding protein n=1 Tax=Leisingera sp. ANG-M1 TaxID=1577895 RepID=UPI000580B132|nr:ABC transporter substrate-binding protein [Leisingera sp. ANG-M1]KIC07859.1 glycine/betaine ABC transporter substrate-binding protein [Leisingera sp. ANG-M1]